MGLQNSKIVISKNIKLDKGYKNVLTYTEQQMVELCYQNAVATKDSYSFIRSEKNFIKTSFSYEDALKCNYMAFQNPDYSNKWFFAFIDDVEYANDGTSKIRYTIDEFATWFDYWHPNPCFIVREHVNDDTIGLHTYPENLEFGEYIIESSFDLESSLNNYTTHLICIGTAYLPSNTPFITDNRIYGGVYSGTYYILFKGVSSASKFIQAMADIGHINDVQCLFMIPLAVAATSYDDGWTTGSLGNQNGIEFKVLLNSTGVVIINDNITISSPNTLNGIVPKNKKLYCYPYNCLSITNNAGMQVEYRYEDFINNTASFSIIAAAPTAGIWVYPNNYKKYSSLKSGYNWGFPCAKYPQGSWNGDMYTNWMVQNGINLFGHTIQAPTSHAIMGSLQAITGAASGDFEGIGSGIGAMFGAVQEQYRASMIPNQIGGQTSVGDIVYAYDKMSPTCYKMTIKEEYIRIIDDWFTKFGYKINRIKQPNITGRRYWNFVQIGTSDDIGYSTNINRSVPAKSMETINTLFRNGVTLWHSHDNVGDYTLNNTII